MLIDQNHQPLNIIAQIGEKQVNLFNNPLNLQFNESQHPDDNSQITHLIAQHLKDLILKKQELKQIQEVIQEELPTPEKVVSVQSPTRKESLTVSH